MTCFQRVGLQLVIGVCPLTNENLGFSEENFIEKLSEELHWKVVQQFTSEYVQWTVSESCPTIHLGGCKPPHV